MSSVMAIQPKSASATAISTTTDTFWRGFPVLRYRPSLALSAGFTLPSANQMFDVEV